MVRGIRAARAWAVDVFNGTEQELTATADGPDTLLPAILVKDYPTFLRIAPASGEKQSRPPASDTKFSQGRATRPAEWSTEASGRLPR